jgi:signal transduction protein with GAF and PtsI domain
MQDYAVVFSFVASLGAVAAVVTLILKRGTARGALVAKIEQATEKAKDAIVRCERLQQEVSDHRVATATDIAIIKTLAETNTVALAAAEARLAKALEEMHDQLGRFTARLDQILQTLIAGPQREG